MRKKHQRRNQKSHVAVLAVVHVALLHAVNSVVIIFIITITIVVHAAAATVVIVATAARAATAATVSDLKAPYHLHSSDDRSTYTWLLRALISVDLSMVTDSHRYEMDH